ncbi:hypothetical protein BH10BDE1_BH10BDE1_06650 [soil metagenome]
MQTLRKISLMAVVSILMGSATSVFAGMMVFTGDAGEKLWIQDAPKLGADVAIMKIEGVESEWQGKLIRVVKSNSTTGDRYHFDYKHGSKTRQYFPIVEAGKTLVAGTITRQVELYAPKIRNPMILKYNSELTKSSVVDLPAEFSKTPYTPKID